MGPTVYISPRIDVLWCLHYLQYEELYKEFFFFFFNSNFLFSWREAAPNGEEPASN